MRIKLVIILFLALIAISLVGYISYRGLDSLMSTLEDTVKPDYREEKFQNLIYQISEAENSVRIYTITQETNYLNSFYNNLHEADTLINDLYYSSRDDKFLTKHLDSISNIIQRKIDIQKRLIELNQNREQYNVYEEVLDKVQTIERRNAVFDSLENAIQQTEEEIQGEMDEKVALEEKEEKEDRPGFFKRLFGSKKDDKKEKEAKEKLASEKEHELDTLIATRDTLSSMIDTLKKEPISKELQVSLNEIEQREKRKENELTYAEMILSKRDKAFSDQLKQEVNVIQQYFDKIDIDQAREASDFFKTTTQLITIIGTISSMAFLILVFIVLNDININQRIRKKLEIAKRKAERLAKAKDEFLSNMSHEIRTPMNAIVGFTDQLEKTDLNPDQKKYFNIIQNASHHLLSIINDILDYSKIEAGKIKIEKVPFSIVNEVKIVYDTLYKNANEKGLDFRLNIDKKFQNISVIGDPVRFRQILFNLAGNAIKFTSKGHVSLFIHPVNDKSGIKIKIVDSGIGIGSKEKSLIFKKFEQADTSTTRKFGGTGLGLSIVKKLIDLQKGKIYLESTKGEGTTFELYLPYLFSNKKIDGVSQLKFRNKVLSERLKNCHILIADDEEYNVLLFETILRKHQVNFTSVNSGKEVITKLKKVKFDLVLMDLQMHEMDGFDTTIHIRKNISKDFPILAVTASVNKEIFRKSKNAGINEVLIKPVNEDELVAKILEYIGPYKPKSKPRPTPQPKSKIQNSRKTAANNFEHVFTLFQNDNELAINMINIYLKSITNAVKAFNDSLKENDFERVKLIAHKTIPSTRHMGFEKLAGELKQLEENIQEPYDIDDINNRTRELIPQMKEIRKNLSVFLSNYQKQNSSIES